MADWDKALVEKLRSENAEFQELYKEHLELETKLERFASLHYLTAQEEMERHGLQKRKLAGKDRMEAMIVSARGNGKG
jgi:uncharacterized protein YdcH (DUF465 family)